jgi:hypothetical protein
VAGHTIVLDGLLDPDSPPVMSAFCRRWLFRSALALLVGCVATDARPCPAGESWIFNRSYYSHQPASEVEIGPQSIYGPVFTRPQGAYVRGGYRRLRVGGNLRCNDDYHYFYESWFQGGEQF